MGAAEPVSAVPDGAGWAGGELRDDALATLAEMEQWRLPAEGWRQVAGALGDMAGAIADRDGDALDRAITDLDALSPGRIIPIDLTSPAPRSLRLRSNMLVHALTGAETLPAPPRRGPALVSSAPVRQELVVHAIAPLDGPWAEAAYRQVRRIWVGVGDLLAATEPVDDRRPPVDLPATCALLPTGPILAARQRPDQRVQAILRREHDVVVLSVGWRADPDAPTWAGCEREWDAVAAGGTGELLGVVRLYLGITPTATTDAVAAGDLWQRDGVSVAGCTLWELPPFDDHHRAERRILAVAPDESHEVLSGLVWSGGGGAIAPLTRYLVDAAKIRYELRVRMAADGALRAAAAGGTEAAALTVLLTKLDDLYGTVDIARSNMATAMRAVAPGAAPLGGLFADDRETADWVASTLADDQRYLRNARERALATSRPSTGGTAPSPTIGLVAALPEEYEAMAMLIDDATEWPIAGDRSLYTRGTVPSAQPGQPHHVVLTMLGDTANNAAAAAVAHLLRSFGSVDQVLMTGIAAGVPMPARPDKHVRLGDTVVSTWGIVDYDHVVDRDGGLALRQGFPVPSPLLCGRAKALAAQEIRGHRPWEDELARLIERRPAFARPDPATDVLRAYDGDDVHPDPALTGHRPGRSKVHEGRIGSANRSLRNAKLRDALAERYDLRAIEMEASGIGSSAFASGREWLVVRGISDYGDSRMGTLWRPYASAVAAAYIRALLGCCPPLDPHGGRTAGNAPI
ncbi:CATRA conflict system CASPASE/TPR repeat-associated protein [Phytohabitans sp. LJ34]|uniref:CATRA conflict system CASPASE/TPR repeat-associated protein n=1 Tax=Phytohabitans sp. LJ34 TaxID=3452217 RepID=UPI003F8B19BD